MATAVIGAARSGSVSANPLAPPPQEATKPLTSNASTAVAIASAPFEE
jgi:hypothetical protein